MVRKSTDPTYDKNKGNTCNDPMAVMTQNGTCECFDLMEDVGQGEKKRRYLKVLKFTPILAGSLCIDPRPLNQFCEKLFS